VAFGIRPTRAETGYGWLALAADPGDFSPRPLLLKRFVEKPKAPQAQAMLEAGTYLWNAGIFLATAGTLVGAFAMLAPGLIAPVSTALAGAKRSPASLELAEGPWSEAEDISVDYAVMERAANLCVVPFAAGWSDLGDWDAIWREVGSKAGGMVTTGDVTAIDCEDSLLRSDTDGVELVGIGLKDMIVVAMQDAILIAPRARVQEVKEAVTRLKARRAKQAEGFGLREGAWSETRAGGQRFASRSLQLAPGAEMLVADEGPKRLWTVLSGTAQVATASGSLIVVPGGAFNNEADRSLRIAGLGNAPLVLVEMQVGASVATMPRSRPVDLPQFAIAAE
jgi:mannose-6-phosphate isomerase-like protein (cupin superfamily)